MRSDDALYALDAATRAIAGELDLDKVLELMVDSLRDLVGARYAALGIVDDAGRIERFITSGISPEQRARIGDPPRGHGLLGTIIREGVTLRIPDIAKHPDTYGFPPNHPPMHSFLGVPVLVSGEPIGNFYLTEKVGATEFDEKDEELVEMFAVHAGIAIQNARLHQQVQRLAVVDERLRISRDLHDGIIQSLYSVGLTLEDVPELMTENPDEAVGRVDRAIDRLHMTIADIRTFITRLALPPDTTLSTAIAETVAQTVRDASLGVELDLGGVDALDGRLSPEAANEVLQIVKEAMSNVVRHSRATQAGVTLAVEGDAIVLSIADDGRGFDPATSAVAGHFGLANLRKRADAVGASLDVRSSPGAGTTIELRLPLGETEEVRR
ncbi:MAG TPA: GAF domain-containing sensor histidine kinase [Candidatus Limnocylindrales bacterium]|nr:GAF domain-containing sensor histidine kinase [Candidatus Limnocylindrales bacterium]